MNPKITPEEERALEDEILRNVGRERGEAWAPMGSYAMRPVLLHQLVREAEEKLRTLDPDEREFREADRRIRGAIRVMRAGTSEVPQPEKLCAIKHALDLAPRLLDREKDERFELRIEGTLSLSPEQRLVKEAELVRLILSELLEVELSKERLSPEVILEAVRQWPATGKKKWEALNEMSKACGCGYASNETFRVEFHDATNKL